MEELIHGTLDGYEKHRCRCKECKGIWDYYIQEYRSDIFDERKARRKKLRIRLSKKDYSEVPEEYGKYT